MRPLLLESALNSLLPADILPEEVAKAVEPGVLEQFFKQLPSQALSFGLKVLLTLILFFVGVKLIGLIRRLARKSLDKAKVDRGVSQFLDSCLKTGLYMVLIFLIASGFGLNAATVAALLGSAGVAIGLAIQGSLSNFAGGLMLLIFPSMGSNLPLLYARMALGASLVHKMLYRAYMDGRRP